IDVERNKKVDLRLEECQKFLNNLKPPVTSYQEHPTSKQSKSTECRRNKDRNFQRCIDLLHWAIHELFKQTGKIVSLYRQIDAALKRVYFKQCPVCGFQSPSTDYGHTATASGNITCYTVRNSAPVNGNHFTIAELAECSRPNMSVGSSANSIPPYPSNEAFQNGYVFVNQPTFPQPPSHETGPATEGPDWALFSELLNSQQDATTPSVLPSSSLPQDPQFRISYALSHDVNHEQIEAVNEIEAWLSTFRLDSDECMPGQTK
ncbi:hypothetical protein AAVH_23973, partial [Aphelenchoides avenae]